MTNLILPKSAHPDFALPHQKPRSAVEVDDTWSGKPNIILPLVDSLRDLRGKTNLALVGSGANFTASAGNKAIVGKGSTSNYYTLAHNLDAASPYTIMWRGYIGEFSTSNDYTWFQFFTSSTSPRATLIVYQEDNAISLGFNGHRVISPKSTLVTGKVYNVAVVSPGSSTGAIELWIDGVKQTLTTETGSGAAVVSGAGPCSFFVETYVSPQRPSTSSIEYLYAWQRVLPDAEIRARQAEPYRTLLKPANDPFVFYYSAGGAVSIDGNLEQLSLSTFQASTSFDNTIAAQLESLLLSTNAASTSLNIAISANIESLVLTPIAASISADNVISAQSESLVITGFQATVTEGSSIQANLESLVLSTNTAGVILDTSISANVESLVLGTNTANITVGSSIEAALESLALNANPAGLELTVNVDGGIETLNLNTLAAVVGIGQDITALTEALTLTANGAILDLSIALQGSRENLTLSTFGATITGGVPALTVPGLEYTLPLSRMGYTLPISRIHFTFKDED